MKVYQAINAVAAQLARDGIGKTRKNDQQGYKFRGIDEVMNALAPLLANHKLIIFPRMMRRECEARQTKSGSVLYSVTVEAEFDFVSAEDGSKHTARTFGEAMDSGDKATNKSMAAAYKYAAFQTFCIPLEGSGDVDADSTTPEDTRPFDKPAAPEPPAAPTASERAAAAIVDPKVAALDAASTIKWLKRQESEALLVLLKLSLDACKTSKDVKDWATSNGSKSGKQEGMHLDHKAEIMKLARDKSAAVLKRVAA